MLSLLFKMMKKIFVTIMSLAVLMSCQDLTELNVDPKRSAVAPAGSLFASAQKSLVDNLTTPNVNVNIFRLLAQQWTETTYTDESNYDLGTRNIPQNWWHAMYRDVLQDLREAKKITTADAKLDAATKTNRLAMIEIMEVYTWAILVDTFGDIPYQDALKVTSGPDDILQPEYDDDAAIYPDLITRLNAALGTLNPGAESWGESDLLYAGDVAHWVKLGNSIKVRLGMMLADVNPGLAKTTVESAAPNVFTSNADNAVFLYKSAPPNTNPVWVNLVQSGRKDFVVANTLVDAMVDLADPRIPAYFSVDQDGGYTGGEYGSSNNYATFSKPADLVDNSDFPASLMDYSEVEFFLAEAAERGFVVGGTAETHYNAAIRASMESWGVEDADITAYLAQADVNYNTATGTFKQKIGTQKWIALYNRGFEAWTEWRRLDYPVLVAPVDAFSDVPLRYTYPVSEQNLNTINYDNAVTSIGEDEVSTPIFWDVN
jgi:hypothetical protein